MIDYYHFMTIPSIVAQENTIRPATANVYLRHAKLFIGWYIKQQQQQNMSRMIQNLEAVDSSQTEMKQHNEEITTILTINDIVPTKEKQSVNHMIAYISWLRSVRHISVSYEASILRGLTKVLKFRFST